MKCYVKSSSTFLTTAQRDADDFSLTLDSMSGEKSTLTILSEDGPSTLYGHWLVYNGGLWRIDGASPKNGKTKLTLLPPDTLFDRRLVYEETNAATIGAFIASIITSEWITQTDPVYATPYMTIASTDTTPFVAPETEEDGTYNLLSYIRQMRQEKNVVLHTDFAGNVLNLTISADPVTVRPLVINDGHTQLISSDFSATALAKVTVFKSVDTGQKDADDQPIMETQVSDWYLAADGTVSDTIPQNRASGEWGSVSISGDEEPADAAAAEFAKNEQSRKIELFSDVEMAVGDKARTRINGEVIETTVTGIYRKNGDNRTRYKCGDLITTLTEKVDALGGGVKVVRVSSGGGGGTTYPAWTGGSY